MNQHDPISHHVRIFQVICEQIAAANELEPDDPFVLDTATGECDLEEAVVRIMKESRARAAQAEGMKALIEEMAARKARLEAGAAKLKQTAHYAMCEAGLKKIASPAFTLIRQATAPGVIVTEQNADLIPDEYCRVSRAPDKAKIKEALKDGAALMFAYLDNAGESLAVRAK